MTDTLNVPSPDGLIAKLRGFVFTSLSNSFTRLPASCVTDSYEKRIRAAADMLVADALAEPAVFHSLEKDGAAKNRNFFDVAIYGEAKATCAALRDNPARAEEAAIRLGGTALLMLASGAGR